MSNSFGKFVPNEKKRLVIMFNRYRLAVQTQRRVWKGVTDVFYMLTEIRAHVYTPFFCCQTVAR